MPNLRSSGVYGGRNSAGGLYEGLPIENVTRRSWSFSDLDFGPSTSAEGATGAWTTTNITSGTAARLTADGTVGRCGIFRLTATTINEGIGSTQLKGTGALEAIYVPAAGRTIVYEALVTCNDWNDCDWFLGIGEIDTTFMALDGTLAANGGDNCIGFGNLLSETNTSPRMYQAGTAVANLVRTPTGLLYDTTILNDTQYAFGLRLEGLTTCSWYFGTRSTGTNEPGGVRWDTKLLQRVTLTNPLVAAKVYSPTFTMIANGAAINFDVDRMFIAQTR